MSAATSNLRDHQRQLDMDGCEVAVSRQALDEALAEIDQLNEHLQWAVNMLRDAVNVCYGGVTHADIDAHVTALP
jgi:hypothetical protein